MLKTNSSFQDPTVLFYLGKYTFIRCLDLAEHIFFFMLLIFRSMYFDEDGDLAHEFYEEIPGMQTLDLKSQLIVSLETGFKFELGRNFSIELKG